MSQERNLLHPDEIESEIARLLLYPVQEAVIPQEIFEYAESMTVDFCDPFHKNTIRVNTRTHDHLHDFLRHARKLGHDPYVASGFRTLKDQEKLYNGSNMIARPGSS